MLGADLGVRTGVWTDFQAVNSDSIRILGRGLGVISLSPRMDVLAGVWYLDRNRVKLLPAGGVHWKPNPEWDAYLVFPNPKVRKRFVNIGSSQWWWYVAGEYGGGRWTVERDPAGLRMRRPTTTSTINDIRVIGGFEWETANPSPRPRRSGLRLRPRDHLRRHATSAEFEFARRHLHGPPGL